MTNQLFDFGREGFLFGEIAWGTGTIKASLLRGYTVNHAHKFVSELVAAGGVLVSTFTLSGKVGPGGIADAIDGTFPTVASGAAIPAVLVYQTSAPTGGADLATSAQRLIGYIDQATNLPVTPNGGNVEWAWDNGANKIFKL